MGEVKTKKVELIETEWNGSFQGLGKGRNGEMVKRY